MSEEVISKDPDIRGGMPVFPGAQVPVRILLEHWKRATVWTTSSKTFLQLLGSKR